MISREEAALKHFEMLARALETGNYYDDFGFKHTYCNITAWMPLPEPYKGVE